jgi:hypothetical protein
MGLDWQYEERREFVVGVDLGQAHDPTAIAVIEHVRVRVRPEYVQAYGTDSRRRALLGEWDRAIRSNHPPQYNVRHLERLPLGTHYPAQVAWCCCSRRRSANRPSCSRRWPSSTARCQTCRSRWH